MLFAFSLTRAVHPEFLPKQTAKEFMKPDIRMLRIFVPVFSLLTSQSLSGGIWAWEPGL